jgi:hypothetical protein
LWFILIKEKSINKIIPFIMNKRLETAFNKFIEEQNKPKTYGYSGGTYGSGYGGVYGGGGQYNSHTPYNAATDCTIFFYEWTNIRGGAKHFKQKAEFFKYLDDCKIAYTEKQKKDIEETKYKNVFATCVPNKAELLTADTWYMLSTILDTYEKSTVQV